MYNFDNLIFVLLLLHFLKAQKPFLLVIWNSSQIEISLILTKFFVEDFDLLFWHHFQRDFIDYNWLRFGYDDDSDLILLKLDPLLLIVTLDKVYDTVLIPNFFVKWISVSQTRLDICLLNNHTLGWCTIVCKLVFHVLVVISPNLFKTTDFVEGTSHVEILKSHSRLKECLKLQITENDFLLHAPVAKVRISFINASPDLQFRINNPNALIFSILWNAVRVIDDVFVTLQIQLKFWLNSKRTYSDHQQ